MRACAFRGQKRALGHLELELLMVVSYLLWVLKINLQFLKKKKQ